MSYWIGLSLGLRIRLTKGLLDTIKKELQK
jgi:hypothetical protein